MIDTLTWSSCSRWSPWLACSSHAINSTGPSVSPFRDFSFKIHMKRFALITLPCFYFVQSDTHFIFAECKNRYISHKEWYWLEFLGTMFFFFNKGLSVWRKTVLSTREETGCWTDATDGQLAGLPTIASGWKWKVEIKGNIGNSSAAYTLLFLRKVEWKENRNAVLIMATIVKE